MKLALMIISFILVSNVFAMEDLKLDFTDETTVEKTVMNQKILLENIMDLQKKLKFEGKRMIAGKFESKKNKKGSYTDNLRSKLDDCSGYSRF